MRPTWVEVNTRSIARNLRHIKSALPPDTQILAVVKADGYGHGAAPVAIRALEEGVSFLGVALVEEGVALRRAGIAAPILFMESPFPWQALDLVKYGLTATVASYESADMLSDAAVVLGKRAKVHVKVDTGMGRLGLSPTATFGLVRHVAKLPGIEIEGIFTHLACAESNLNMTRRQLEQFDELGSKLSAEGYDIPIRHAANSAAALTLPETFYDMVRVGGIMYGLSPLGTVAPSEPWTPALSFHTRVSYIKPVRPETPISYGASYVTSGPELIATLPVGYADGYPRALSNVGEVLIGGRRYMGTTWAGSPPSPRSSISMPNIPTCAGRRIPRAAGGTTPRSGRAESRASEYARAPSPVKRTRPPSRPAAPRISEIGRTEYSDIRVAALRLKEGL
jgi:alanine racemase